MNASLSVVAACSKRTGQSLINAFMTLAGDGIMKDGISSEPDRYCQNVINTAIAITGGIILPVMKCSVLYAVVLVLMVFCDFFIDCQNLLLRCICNLNIGVNLTTSDFRGIFIIYRRKIS